MWDLCRAASSHLVTLQVQCFDSSGTKVEFQPLETFGFLPVPEVLMEDALRGVEVRRAFPKPTFLWGKGLDSRAIHILHTNSTHSQVRETKSS